MNNRIWRPRPFGLSEVVAFDLIIFDFDGVIADSERLACGVAASLATKLGAPMSGDEGLDLFMGKRLADVQAIVEARAGRLYPSFGERLQRLTLAAFETELTEVNGATAFIRSLKNRKKCIASSSSPARLGAALRSLGLDADFSGAIFSADDVKHGKPAPDLFLFAAHSMDVEPAESLVIEDSVGGVQAGVAAGMTVIGLLAGSHIRDGHATRLVAEGAVDAFSTFDDVAAWICAPQK